MTNIYAHRKTARSFVWLIAGMLIFSPLGQHAVGLVLCIETDGHMSIEDAIGLICGPDASPHQHQSTAETDTTSHCGTCIDIPLYVAGDTDCASFLISTRQERVDLPVVDVIATSTIVRPSAPYQVHTQVRTGTDLSLLTDLRSIVLLI